MKKFFAVRPWSTDVTQVLFLIRVVTGIAFILHGWGKIQNPFGWMPDGSIPGIFQALAAVAEFGGGIALILGALTRLASLGILITMIVAFYKHAFVFGHPFVGHNGSYEPATVYILISLLLLVMGPGRWSLDYKIFGLKNNL